MRPTEPFVREAGSGPGVVCLHSNASSSSQWRALMECLAPEFHVLAVDSHGAGKGPPWPVDRKLALGDEVVLLEGCFSRTGGSAALVGHSYGGALALVAAAHRPESVRALALYEPTLFSLVEALAPSPNGVDGIRRAVQSAATELARGRHGAAAECFIDFWMGAGSWRRMPQPRRAPIESAIVSVAGWADALFGEPAPASAFAALDIPVLLMAGKESPESSLSVARLLAQTLRRVELVEFEGLGHMGPITHPDQVNAAIADFLRRFGRARRERGRL